MRKQYRNTLVNAIVTPNGLATISSAIFVISWLFPPRLYETIVGERNIIFCDMQTALLFVLCVGGFVTGTWYVSVVFPTRTLFRRKIHPWIPAWMFILMPILIGVLFSVISIVLLIRQYPSLIVTLLAASGTEVKDAYVDFNAPLGLATTALTGVVWWGLWRCEDVPMTRRCYRVVAGVLYCALFLVIVYAVLKVNRSEIMPPVVGTAVLLISRKGLKRSLNMGSALRCGGVLVTLVLFLFSFFAFIRGVDANGLTGSIVGYTVASYNRLAAVVHRELRYPYAGNGVYLSDFIAYNKTFNSVIPIHRLLQWPDAITLWQSEFSAASAARLNEGLIWSGAFGYLFADLGWLCPVVLVCYGLLYGFVWRWVRKGSAVGIVLYPWCAFWILLWCGYNHLLDTRAVVLLLDAIGLIVYERVFARQPSSHGEGASVAL